MPKYDLIFDPPLMNAAGFQGFAPEAHSGVNTPRLGAFVTNPISLEARSPAHSARFEAYPGGFVLHTGHPNPGLKAILHRYAPKWQRAALPVIVHLLAQAPAEVAHMARALEGREGVVGLEIGLPPDVTLEHALAIVGAAQGELPIVLRLPLDRAVALGEALAESSSQAANEILAVSLGAPRGVLPQAAGGWLHGRLYGPALFPHMLAVLNRLRSFGLAVIAAGGIYSRTQVEAALAAGALAVQLDAVLWRNPGLIDW